MKNLEKGAIYASNEMIETSTFKSALSIKVIDISIFLLANSGR